MHDSTKIALTDRQLQIATTAVRFLQASSEAGLAALADEATGYRYRRVEDAACMKLKLELEAGMRKWEKTFFDPIWSEFGRLTNWKGSGHGHSKYWDKLVMELIHGALDTEVAGWLRENAPKPITGQSHPQWLNEQYGLKKLVEHIWIVIGMASTCRTMPELRQRMMERFAGVQTQLALYSPLRH